MKNNRMISGFKSFRNGFTLIEILIAVVLLGLAMAAIVASNIAFTQATTHAAQLSTAEFLIEQIRERTALLSYGELYNLNGTFNPPQDSNGRELTNFSDYSQVVEVKNVSDSDFQQADASSNFIRVTVRILYDNTVMDMNTSWIRSAD